MNIKDVITKVEYNIPIGPKDFIKMFVANAEERIFTKLFPNNIALIIIALKTVFVVISGSGR